MPGQDDYPNALPAGYRLHWYVLEHVLGQGGFGITYLARDTNLDRRVAIKEYLPSEIARRRSDAAAHPHTESQAERYAWGLERFLSEARTLARFVHPNIVQVHSVFEANNTAYMVMRFEEGENLARMLDRCGTLPEPQLLGLLLPILDGLRQVHAAGFIHRDIKPGNIYMRQDGSPVLLDFGSARQAFGTAKTMTILVAPGYAPLEQYYSEGATQGPWTDIYGLGATCWRAITGRVPVDAIARAKGVLGSAREMLQSAVEAGQGRYDQRLLKAVDHALQLSERDRPQDVATWRAEILAGAGSERTDLPQPAPPVPLAAAVPTRVDPAAAAAPRARRARWWQVAAGALAVGLIVLAIEVLHAPSAPMAQVQAAVPQVGPAGPASSPGAEPQVTLPLPGAPEKTAAPSHPAPSFNPIRPKAAPVSLAAVQPVTGSMRQNPGVRPSIPTTPQGALLEVMASAPQLPTESAPPPGAGVVATVPTAKAASSVVVAVVNTAPAPVAESNARQTRVDPVDTAAEALRRGDHGAAAQLLMPLAASGLGRAQLLLGQLRESASGRLHSDYQAYLWYGIAARSGAQGAAALREKVANRLQPAEIQQANEAIDNWRASQ